MKPAAPGTESAYSPTGKSLPTLALVFSVFVIVCLSRIAVFPASIWEQDEAYFATAVIEIDLADSAPHPPFFPLWIAAGKLFHLTGLDPARGLQVASAVLGSLVFLPLVALWSRFMSPARAVAASTLGLAIPGVWMLSGRALSGTAATAMLVSALACWTRPTLDRRWLATGSLAAGLAILIRPQFGLVVVVVMAVVTVGLERQKWFALIAPAATVTLLGTVTFILAAGGIETVAEAVSRHAAYHFTALPTASRHVWDSGLARVFGHPMAALVWCVLAVWGAWMSVPPANGRAAGLPVMAALITVVGIVFGFSNPAHPRYGVPIVILSSGFVVLALGRALGERSSIVAATTAVTAATVVVLPAAPVYRPLDSPPLRALALADQLASERDGTVVADRTLHSFVLYREAMGRSSAPVVFDHLLELGAELPGPPASTVMVFDADHDGLLVDFESRQTFSCNEALLRHLAQDRFLDVTVASGAELRVTEPPNHPIAE